MPSSRVSARRGASSPSCLRGSRPGDGWRGTISAPGSLASGRWVRVVFGPLVAVGDPPDDMRSRFVWITDHAYRLRARP